MFVLDGEKSQNMLMSWHTPTTWNKASFTLLIWLFNKIFSEANDGYQKKHFIKSRKLLDWVFIYLQLYRFELVRLLIWCSTYILISIGVLDTSSCFFHFSITCGDIIHWVATIVIDDICSKIDQNNI